MDSLLGAWGALNITSLDPLVIYMKLQSRTVKTLHRYSILMSGWTGPLWWGDQPGDHSSPLQRYLRLDQMMFSWEKQNTPSRPPLMVVSMVTPESATNSVPS